MIKISVNGDFKNMEKLLKKSLNSKIVSVLSSYGREGVQALSAATPVDSGLTASSWSFEIKTTKRGYEICWKNSNINDGVPIAIILQYGHASRSGSYVEGIDYINPITKPIFDRIANDFWKEVTD